MIGDRSVMIHAERLKEAREAKGWSQARLARELGCRDEILRRAGLSRTRTKTVERIAELLDVAVDWLSTKAPIAATKPVRSIAPEQANVPFHGSRIKTLAALKGIALTRLSKSMGRHWTNLNGKILDGNTYTTVEYAQDLAKALGVPYETIVNTDPAIDAFLSDALSKKMEAERASREQAEMERVAEAQGIRTSRGPRQRAHMLRRIYRTGMTAVELMRASGYTKGFIYSIMSGTETMSDSTRDAIIDGDEAIGPDVPGEPAAGAMETLAVGGGVVLALLIAEDRRRGALLDRIAGMTEMEADSVLQKLEGLRI